jgi:curved DNA-binding protein CbpA
LTSATSSRLPRLLPGADLRALTISPAEAFVVSRIDGTTTVAEIAEETGKAVEEVLELFERLARLGVVALDERIHERRQSPAPGPRPSGALRLGPIVETTAVGEQKHPAASLYDPAELDEAVDIDLERRRRILDLYYRLDQLNHYQLFAVDPTVDKKAIKSAYFEIVNVFHPDRYFGKNVGSFKPKLERVFARLTQSYDVLSRAASRAEYDAYLRAQSKTRAFDAGQIDNAAHQAALQEVMRRIQAEASVDSRGPSIPPPSPDLPPPPSTSRGHQDVTPIGSSPPRVSSPANPALRPSASMRPSAPEERRRALARKLGRAPQVDGKEPPTPDQVEEQRQQTVQQDTARQGWAADELKRRYQDRIRAARDRQIEAYTRAADQALDKGDNVGASNALRIAVSLAPEDSALQLRLNEVAGRATHELSASYFAQAEYEERDEKWLSAAKSYARALVGRPEAKIYDKLAHCLLSGEGDLREAGEAAKKAVLMQPDNARFRVNLARFYVKAGMKQSAEGELSRAATLGSGDDKVADWIRRLKRELG